MVNESIKTNKQQILQPLLCTTFFDCLVWVLGGYTNRAASSLYFFQTNEIRQKFRVYD